MRKNLLLLLLSMFCGTIVLAQNNELYMPKEMKKAYQKNTRSLDGKPGANFYQNRTDYLIRADFEPTKRKLSGRETITYQNNSPDTLKHLVFNLFQDLYKKGNKLDWSIGVIDLNDGVEIASITVGGKDIDLKTNAERNETQMFVKLNENPLAPHAKIEIDIKWSFVLPSQVNIRMGTYDSTSFFVGYWYPKLAVYDDIYGWNYIGYSGNLEFYNDYGNFDVEITAPKDYLVWSSGLLQNASEVYSPSFLEKYSNALKTNDITNLVTQRDRKKGGLTSASEQNTWKFKAENLTDFAFALSDTYLWDATGVDVNGKRVAVNAVYKSDTTMFSQVAEITKSTIQLLSTDVMGVPYPYPQMTAFQGHYGMEYPMMVNDGDDETRDGTVFVTAHEVGHSYFPFYVGCNEQRYAWMDEGLITLLPKYIESKLSDKPDYKPFLKAIKQFNNYAGSERDMPLLSHSQLLSDEAYRLHAYGKSAMALYSIRQLLGDEMFKKCLVEFINRWNGKHPTGYDFLYTFANVSEQNLNWFIQPWFFEFGTPDLGIGTVSAGTKNNKIEIQKVGKYPVPIKLTVTYTDDSFEMFQESASVWKDGKTVYSMDIKNKKTIKKLALGDAEIPDTDATNNTKEIK